VPTASTLDELLHAAESRPGYRPPAAWGLGLATLATGGADPLVAADPPRVLDVWYPRPRLADEANAAAVLAELAGARGPGGHRLGAAAANRFDELVGDAPGPHPNRDLLRALAPLAAGTALPPRALLLTLVADLEEPPVDVADCYLRLHLLSARLVRPHGVNLDGVFGLLPNVVFTTHGAFTPDSFDAVVLTLRGRGEVVGVHGVDKFPRMTDYVLPTGVRIADANRVRLGAHLAEGTTVMHEGFVNYNAGTLGASMVEGRISAGVVVGDGSDIGGGSSTMGTLSGGGSRVIAIGEGCLLGANSGLGIPLGDRCTVEAGLYLTAGAKVRMPDGEVVKAAALAGSDDLLFRRNSETGAIEAVPRAGAGWQGLNAALHENG
jgi:2,3,4,5-tetrahydropyridine-2-carboxylate N-succinyltransferase